MYFASAVATTAPARCLARASRRGAPNRLAGRICHQYYHHRTNGPYSRGRPSPAIRPTIGTQPAWRKRGAGHRGVVDSVGAKRTVSATRPVRVLPCPWVSLVSSPQNCLCWHAAMTTRFSIVMKIRVGFISFRLWQFLCSRSCPLSLARGERGVAMLLNAASAGPPSTLWLQGSCWLQATCVLLCCCSVSSLVLPLAATSCPSSP